MSVERRLREGLERSASAVQPDVGRRLPEAIARAGGAGVPGGPA